MVHYY